jgi:large subunit ribosomal protein L3
MKFILGKKIGMTTIYTEEKAQNVTLIETGVNKVSDIMTNDKDGYVAIQITMIFDKGKDVIKEFRVDEIGELKKGDKVSVDIFTEGEKVVINSISKGKGYQGVVKRHNFAGGPASHGHRHALRSPGSIGSAFPERVMKGKRMAGRMGTQSVTVKNLEVIKTDDKSGIIAIKGAVPGNKGTIVKIIEKV